MQSLDMPKIKSGPNMKKPFKKTNMNNMKNKRKPSRKATHPKTKLISMQAQVQQVGFDMVFGGFPSGQSFAVVFFDSLVSSMDCERLREDQQEKTCPNNVFEQNNKQQTTLKNKSWKIRGAGHKGKKYKLYTGLKPTSELELSFPKELFSL